jgi:hypothetical protein
MIGEGGCLREVFFNATSSLSNQQFRRIFIVFKAIVKEFLLRCGRRSSNDGERSYTHATNASTSVCRASTASAATRASTW